MNQYRRDAEVRQLDGTLLRHQQVSCLDVPVQDLTPVEVPGNRCHRGITEVLEILYVVVLL
jgi:hypothetical protein